MALIRHLDKMVKAKVLDKRSIRIKKGRPRTYYGVSKPTKLTVNIAPDRFLAKVEESNLQEEGVYTTWLNNIKSYEDPMQKLTSLSELAEDIQKEIRIHEEAILRLESVLSEIRKIGKEAVKQLDIDEVDRNILVHLIERRGGSVVEEISKGIGEDIASTEKHLGHLKEEGILGYSSSLWKLK